MPNHPLIHSFLNIACALIMVWLLSGCGYQLQKPLSIDQQLQPVYVEGPIGLTVEIKRLLISHGIAVSRKKSGASSSIYIDTIDNIDRSTSVSFDGRDAERLLLNQVAVSWRRGPQNLIEPTIISAETVQLANPDRRASQRSESELLTKELHMELADKTLQLIRHTAPSH